MIPYSALSRFVAIPLQAAPQPAHAGATALVIVSSIGLVLIYSRLGSARPSGPVGVTISTAR